LLESKPIQVEVFPVVADPDGLWLILPDRGQDALRSTLPIRNGERVHDEAELLLASNGIDMSLVPVLHSTSWRDDAAIVLTYMAVVNTSPRGQYARAQYPHAQPIDLSVFDAVGKPLPHGAADEPRNRLIDVLGHGLRHVLFLHFYDEEVRAALDDNWLRHLSRFAPALAGAYRDVRYTIAPLPGELGLEQAA
jgi:hypothetical protein